MVILESLIITQASMSLAQADGGVDQTLGGAAQLYRAVAPDLADDSNNVSGQTGGGEALIASVGVGSANILVNVPQHPDDPLQLGLTSGEQVSLALPFQAGTSTSRTLAAGLIGYAATASSVETLVQATEAGAVRVLTVAASADAPEVFAFPLGLPHPDDILVATGDGGVDVVDVSNVTEMSVSPPWAKDSAGKVVPSWYSIDGSTIELHLDYTNVTFPVVADPELTAPADDPAAAGWGTGPDTSDYAAGGTDPQCSLSVQDRTGGWTCPDESDGAQAAGLQRGMDAGEITATTSDNSYCTVKGCWTRYGNISSGFSSNGQFGYGNKGLGVVQFYYETRFTQGSTVVDKPIIADFYTSVDMNDAAMEGDRLYYSAAHPEGKGVHDAAGNSEYGLYGPYPVIDDRFSAWPNSGYKSRENTVQHGGVVHELSFTVKGYPGNWFVFGKSIKFDKTPASAVPYRVGSKNYLGKNPAGAGYHAG